MSRLLDFFKGIISLVLIAALLVGVPAILLVIVGFPLPTEMPVPSTVLSHISDGDIPDLFVIKTLALLVWLVWVQLAVAVLTELFALARGRVAGRAPVIPGFQHFAGKLVASTVLVISALTPNRGASAAPIVPIEAEQVLDVDAMSDANPYAAESGTRNGLSSSVTLPQEVRSSTAANQYTTTNSDNWWDMAERLLGDGMRWSELRDLNSGKTMLTGEVISNRTETVRGGWQLDVPADAESTLLTPGGGVVVTALAPEAATPEEQADPEVATLSEAAEVAADGDAATADAPVDIAAAEVDQATGADTAADPAQDGHQSSPLMDAIKPYILVYEGPTGAEDPGPGVPYQVVEGDNLWDIAARHLGDPFRWPEIFERSNDLEQSFGRQITDPNLIWPDSILWLPTDAVNVPQADMELVAEVVGPVGPADSPDEDGQTDVTPGALKAAAEAAAEAAPTGDPAIELPGGVPGSNGPAGGAEPPNGPEGDDRTLVDDLAGPVGLAVGVGGALVASGLLGMLRRARKVRLSEVGERSQPAPPPMELVEIETVLRNGADSSRTASVHSAIRSLVDRPIVTGEPLAAPEVIRISNDRVEVVQQRPDPDLPAPWIQGDDQTLEALGGRSLAVLPAEFFPDESVDGDDGTVPAPTCVTVGGGMLLNLEAVGVVAIDGSVEISAGLVRSMVHELATGPARRSIDVRVSNWLPGADLHEHVRCGPLDNLVGELQPWLEDVELGLAASGGYSAYALRAGGIASSMPSPKVIFADAADAPVLAPLIAKAQRHALPLAIVFSGDIQDADIDPTVTLRLEGDTLRLEPYGFTAAMQYLDVDLVLGVEALVHHARQAPMIPRLDEQSTILPLSEHDTDPAQAGTEETPEHDIDTELPIEQHEVTDQSDDADGGVLIRVLGPVEFDGGPADLTEDERSLLTFLALVGPSTAEQIKDAVWPGGRIDQPGFEAVIDRLRTNLRQQFPDAGDGRYRVRSIITDLGSARRWITQADAMAPDRARNLLQLALSDVRGVPFTGVNERAWQWIADHKMAIGTQASTMLMDACFDLCDNAYGANDIHVAKWACDVGALLDPLQETVVVRRVQLMQVLGQFDEASQIVDDWEVLYADTAARPAPRGPRVALEAGISANAENAGTPYVS